MPPRPADASSTRVTPKVLVVLAALLLAARVALEAMAAIAPPPVVERVTWQAAETALDDSRSNRKPVLYLFTADWSEASRRMQREVLADRRAANVFDQLFIPVKVIDRQREAGRNPIDVAALEARYGVTEFPTVVIVDPRGSDPVVIAGYPGKQKLLERITAAGVKNRLAPRVR